MMNRQALVRQLLELHLDLVTKYTDAFFIENLASIDEEFCAFLQALINLKKLLPEDHDSALYLEIEEFLLASIRLSQEIIYDNHSAFIRYKWSMCKSDRVKNLTEIVKKYEEVVQAINKNDPELPQKCTSLVSSARKLPAMLQTHKNIAASVALAITGAVLVLVGLASVVALPLAIPALVYVGLLAKWTVYALGPVGLVLGAYLGCLMTGGGAIVLAKGVSGIAPRMELRRVETSVKKMTKVQLKFFRESTSQHPVPANDANSASLQPLLSSSTRI